MKSSHYIAILVIFSHEPNGWSPMEMDGQERLCHVWKVIDLQLAAVIVLLKIIKIPLVTTRGLGTRGIFDQI